MKNLNIRVYKSQKRDISTRGNKRIFAPPNRIFLLIIITTLIACVLPNKHLVVNASDSRLIKCPLKVVLEINLTF